jgi:hypothetical protein
MMSKNAVSYLESFNILSSLNHTACRLVSKHEWCPTAQIPVHKVAPADSARFHFYQNLVWANSGFGFVFDSYVV